METSKDNEISTHLTFTPEPITRKSIARALTKSSNFLKLYLVKCMRTNQQIGEPTVNVIYVIKQSHLVQSESQPQGR